MATEQIVVQITLDNGSMIKGIAEFEKKARSAGDSVGKSLSGKVFQDLGDSAKRHLGYVGSLIEKIPVSLGIAGGAIFAFKKLFDFAKEGEQITALEKRFDLLAAREGINAEKIKQSLIEAGGGLVSLNDLFQSASRSIAVFGDQAERLPELLSASKKIAITLGLDTVETFEGISKAIETGNQKALKNAGIIVDVDNVYKEYAKTLGLTSGELNQTQKQTALLDATLKQAQQTYKGINDETTPLNNATKILGVAFQDLGEKIKQSISSGLGKSFAEATLTLANAINAISGVKSPSAELDLLTVKLSRLKDEILLFQNAAKGNESIYRGEIELRKQAISSIEAEISLRKAAAGAALDDERKAAAMRGDISERVKSLIGGNENKITEEQRMAIAQRSAQVAGAITQNEQSVITSREKLLQYETDASARKIIQQDILNQQVLLLEQEQQAKINEINKTYSDAAGFNETQRNELRLAAIRDFALRRTVIETEANEALAIAAKQNAERIQIIQTGLTTVIGQGVVKMSQALLKGGNAFEEFGKSIVGIIADQIISLGQALVIQGFAIESFVAAINTLLPGSGMAAAAAGLGLVLFGTALKSAVGAGGGENPTPSVTPGAAGGAGGFGGETTSSSFDLANEPKTIINLNVEGSIMDTPETGLRLSQILSDSFQNQGTTLVQS